MKFDQWIDEQQEAILETIQTLIRFNSIEETPEPGMPFGKTVAECLEKTLDICKAMGFSTKNIDNYAGHAEYGQGEELVGLLVHLDIVPAGEGWTVDPFAGVIQDGKLFGRGVMDDKGPAVSLMYALAAIKATGVKLSRRVRIIFGCNEETGSKCVEHYFEHEEMPTLGFTPDADFPAIFGEKGIMIFDLVKPVRSSLEDGGFKLLHLKGGQRPNMVPDYAEASIQGEGLYEHILTAYNTDRQANIVAEKTGDIITFKSYGVSAHGSTPEKGNNAISHLLCFLDCLDLAIGDATNFVRFYALQIGLELNGEHMGIALEDEQSGKLVLNSGVLSMTDQEVRLTINIRYPITETFETVLTGMTQTLEPWGIAIENMSNDNPLYVPKDSELITKLMAVYQDYTGDKSEPIAIGGGTYAKSLKQGVAFGPLLPGREDTIHQKDEYMLVEDIMLMTKIFATAIYELAK